MNGVQRAVKSSDGHTTADLEDSHQRPPRRVLLVVVTYMSEETIGQLLESVRDWLSGDSARRFSLIDNSRSESTLALANTILSANADQVQAKLSDRNVGFSPAVNSAVKSAEKQWGHFETILLVNPDIVGASEALVAAVDLLADRSVGISAPLLVNSRGDVDRGSLRRDWNRRRLFAEVAGAPSLALVLGSAKRDIRRGRSGRLDVDITSGGFMAIRRRVFGPGLDERLPMYFEDQEICIRARGMGMRIVVATECEATHIGGVSRKGNNAHARALRMMELAAAPGLALMAVTKTGEIQLRLIVACAGGLRWIAASAVFIGLPRKRLWAIEQRTLAKWFMAWSISNDVFASVELGHS